MLPVLKGGEKMQEPQKLNSEIKAMKLSAQHPRKQESHYPCRKSVSLW